MDNLSIVVGSTWEQGFIRFNQFYKVYVQASPEFRRFPEDLDNMFVKNDKGEMVPYSAFMTIKKKQGLNEINRYNLYPSAAIQGAPAPGYSSGQAIQAIQEVAAETLPRGYDIGWEGLSYDEAKKGNEAVYIFLIVVVFVYLVLVGQYESFILPLAVILSLPVGLFGSFFFLQAMGLANDVYAQIGLVMLVGLLGKNAILIVEFAVQRRQEGLSHQGGGHRRREAALPADSDDLLRLHRRSPSAGRRHRRRGDRKPHHRHHRGRRDARGHRDRRPGHSRPVLLVRQDCRRAQTPPGRGGRTAQRDRSSIRRTAHRPTGSRRRAARAAPRCTAMATAPPRVAPIRPSAGSMRAAREGCSARAIDGPAPP